MLAIAGLVVILAVLIVIMTKKMSPMLTLIAVPVVACLLIGQGPKLGKFMTDGIRSVAPTGTMFIFSVLFFSVMGDNGCFERIVNRILKIIGTDPVKITIGTLIITIITHLDGSGATTFLITVPALLPIYEKLKMSRFTLATIVAMGAGTMNIVPWGGPTMRAATALNVSLVDLYNPMVIPQLCGLAMCFILAFLMGKQEKQRLGNSLEGIVLEKKKLTPEEEALRRPKLFWFNLVLIIVTIISLTLEVLPPAGCFMVALVIAMVVNYPNVETQKKLVDQHADAALMMASVLFAAGVFTGIMKNSGMLVAMANLLISLMPTFLQKHLALLLGITSMPLSLAFDPDSFYFAVLPVLATTAKAFGLDPLVMGRAAICGQITVGFPISPLTPSTFLLIGLAGVDLGEHQKHSFIPLWIVSLTIVFVAVLLGVIPV